MARARLLCYLCVWKVVQLQRMCFEHDWQILSCFSVATVSVPCRFPSSAEFIRLSIIQSQSLGESHGFPSVTAPHFSESSCCPLQWPKASASLFGTASAYSKKLSSLLLLGLPKALKTCLFTVQGLFLIASIGLVPGGVESMCFCFSQGTGTGTGEGGGGGGRKQHVRRSGTFCSCRGTEDLGLAPS